MIVPVTYRDFLVGGDFYAACIMGSNGAVAGLVQGTLDGEGKPVLSPTAPAAGHIASAASFSNFTQWSPQTRNQLFGPHFFDLDLTLFRNFKLAERVTFGLGIAAYNALNHPNFSTPDANIGDSTFGAITGMVNSPTSPYGTFLGFDSSVRVVQLSGKLNF